MGQRLVRAKEGRRECAPGGRCHQMTPDEVVGHRAPPCRRNWGRQLALWPLGMRRLRPRWALEGVPVNEWERVVNPKVSKPIHPQVTRAAAHTPAQAVGTHNAEIGAQQLGRGDAAGVCSLLQCWKLRAASQGEYRTTGWNVRFLDFALVDDSC
jgi:hypothetical protein